MSIYLINDRNNQIDGSEDGWNTSQGRFSKLNTSVMINGNEYTITSKQTKELGSFHQKIKPFVDLINMLTFQKLSEYSETVKVICKGHKTRYIVTSDRPIEDNGWNEPIAVNETSKRTVEDNGWNEPIAVKEPIAVNETPERTVDEKTELEWLHLKALQGDHEAQCVLACTYFLGIGGKEDYAEGSKWLQLAVEGRYPQAQYILACQYLDGDGIEQSDEQGTALLELAAKQGHPEAQYDLGCLYFEGKGVKEDHRAGAQWIQLAVKNGHKDPLQLGRKLF